MEIYTGKIVHGGVAAGSIYVINAAKTKIIKKVVDNPQAELAKVENAIEKTKVQIEALYQKTLTELGKPGAEILAAYKTILEDEAFTKLIHDRICTGHVCGEYAVYQAGNHFADVLRQSGDEYIQARAEDVTDVTDRVVRILLSREMEIRMQAGSSIIVAEDLTPGHIASLDKGKILAIATVHGSRNSHASILAGMMNIPVLRGVNIDIHSIKNGLEAIVDGCRGELIINPDRTRMQEAEESIRLEKERKDILDTFKGRKTITQSGREIKLLANIGSVGDLAAAIENDAEGIGLFRTEFLYTCRDSLPTEEEQLEIYSHVLRTMGDKKVIIRTLDAGADKQTEYLGIPREENPALGLRGIRYCLVNQEIFKTQLRALFRAAPRGNLGIMYPMIISVEEIFKIKKILEDVVKELESGGLEYSVPEQGIMIETPAAAVISDRLAELVDFFSLGTNDLSQYTLAADRQNESLDAIFDASHEAVLRLMELTIKNAHKAGIWVGICGEMAGYPELTESFVRMGVDELSVAASGILALRKAITEIR